jgi:predicted proteasome-type protease
MGILIVDECVQCKTNYMQQKHIKNLHYLDSRKSILVGGKVKGSNKNIFLFYQKRKN